MARGFASLTPERRKEIARRGGKAAMNRHQWTSETGRAAGQRSAAKLAQLRAARKAKKEQG